MPCSIPIELLKGQAQPAAIVPVVAGSFVTISNATSTRITVPATTAQHAIAIAPRWTLRISLGR